MELLWKSIQMDWPVLLPILVCSILVVGVVINMNFLITRKTKECCIVYSKITKRTCKKQS